MPDAGELSTDYTFKEDSHVASSDDWLCPNKIFTEEQRAGVIKGQEVMKEAIKDNKRLCLKAKNRAKELIVNHIRKLGEAADLE